MLGLRNLFQILRIRFWLMIRQKLGWMSFLVGIGLVLMSVVTARVSFVKPEKIFWDFSLGVIFLLQTGLAVYLGSQIYPDEKNRRTLHLLLSAGVSRGAWVWGNVLGLWTALSAILAFWFVSMALTSLFVFGQFPWMMAFQTVLLMGLETLVLLAMGVLVSFIVRPLLALTATAALTALLHSLSQLQRVFTDPQVGVYIEEGLAKYFLFAARFLPPLEWFDLKPFVGFDAALPWATVLPLALVALLWAFVLNFAATLKFERMDL